MNNDGRKPGTSSAAASRRRTRTFLAGGGIAVVLAIFVVLRFAGPKNAASSPDTPLTPAMLAEITGVSPSVLAAVGAGTAEGDLHALPGPTRLGSNGKPIVIYMGAEYCPYCAVERWPLIVAMSRFGTFKNLGPARSAADDVMPLTPTFTFVGSTYESQYLDFSSVEVQSSTKVGNTYATLQTPTALQNEVFQRFNGPPFIPSDQAGGIPFIDIADRYMANGATYDPRVLTGLSRDTIASRLGSADNDQSRGILGAANRLTATMCVATSNAPADVCQQPPIQQIETTLPKAPTA